MKECIAIIDLGGQYCHLIARRLRDIGIRSDIFGSRVSLDVLSEYAGIILSGGPKSVYEQDASTVDRAVLDLGIPILGICYGHQLLARMLNGKIERGNGEYGLTHISVSEKNTIFNGTPPEQKVWMSHTDTVTLLPENTIALAVSEHGSNAAYECKEKRFYGVQFHPEVVHTKYGSEILKNFIFGVCNIQMQEELQDREKNLLNAICNKVGNASVFFLVSGGVDSTVAFVLCAKALGLDRVLGLYIDTGLMRKGETDELKANLSELGLSERLKIRDESKEFLANLTGVIDPEEKRRIIGRLFVDIQSKAMQEYGIEEKDWLLGQGTIYPDTIESGGTIGRAAVIKTHHNRCQEITELVAKGRVLEPLAEFYKDEVRQLGRVLGMPPRLTNRWPFPGPGLAIRCLCTDSESDAQPSSPELTALIDNPDYEAAILPIQSVGVQGDTRTYKNVVALRGPTEYKTLEAISTRICNSHSGINRVISLISGKISNVSEAVLRPSRIETHRIELLREADHIVRSVLEKKGLTDSVWQFPVVLLPVSYHGGETIVLRPVNSSDGMTANFAKLPHELLEDIASQVGRLDGVDAVFLDITNKPPATIEWE